jgi:drug/metabolite transporter (DMT)-like permease
VWLALSERPPQLTLLGGGVVILAVLLFATERTRAPVVSSAGAPHAAR